ncbi:MAG: creatininase family protein [Gemmatimonadales bacterium]
MSSIRLEHLTSPEAGAAIANGFTTAVFGVGAVEQHGPHLPMFMDAEHGTRMAVEVATRLGHTLVAPTIRVGCSDHHMSFPGSLTVRAETLEALCRDYCTSLARHGFTRILIIPTHGGNFAPLRTMAPRLQEAVAGRSRVLIYTDVMDLIAVWRRATAELSELADRVGGHADVAETSVMLAIHPELVQMDRAEEGFRGELDEAVLARMIKDGLHTVTANGILGDARGATAAIGERCITRLADRIAGYFRELSGAD